CRWVVHPCRMFGRIAAALIVACGVVPTIATVGVPGSAAAAANICDDSSRGTAAVKLLCAGIERQDRGDIDGAIADFQRAIELQPNLIEAHLMLGTGYYDKEDFAQAIVEFNKYLAVISDNYHAWSNRAAALLKSGNAAAARADIDRALALNPHDPQLLWNRIVIARATHDWPSIITDTTWLLDHYPPEAKWLVQRGRALEEESRYTASLADLQRAVELSPTAVAYFYLGITRGDLGQYESAVEDFTRALAINSNLALAYLSRCKAQYELQQFRAGISDCDEYVKRNPEDYEGYYVRGILRSRARDQSGALADYHRAIELANTASERANAWYGVGLASARAGRVKDARQAYERALEFDPEHRLAKEALSRLRP
ncbi:MAG: tetratricopeptide repeat protein, partial [Alphaproteobacteria bacterium]|nr:tetratricopeptide repeat protein [Alphaproteobacteria bacterium]